MMQAEPSIILLNGTSSSGKSTLTARLQARLEPVFLHFSEDGFFNTLPGDAWCRPDFVSIGTALYDGFARSTAASALEDCVETIVRAWRQPVADPAFSRLRTHAVPA